MTKLTGNPMEDVAKVETEKQIKALAPKIREKVKESAFDRFKQAIQEMTEEERERAETFMGTTLREVPPDSDPEARNWGYYCNGCGHSGLTFLGSHFYDRSDEIVDYVPPGITFERLPWVSDEGNAYKSRLRSNPVCQNCGNFLKNDGGRPYPKNVIHLPTWDEDKRLAKAAQKKTKRQTALDRWANGGRGMQMAREAGLNDDIGKL
jgi:hypothetical protein